MLMGFFAFYLFVVIRRHRKSLLSEMFHLVLEFIPFRKVCVVHSTELNLLKCCEFQTSCILMYYFGSPSTPSFADLPKRLHTIQTLKTTCNCCTVLTTDQFTIRILYFTRFTHGIIFVEQIFRWTQPLDLSHAHCTHNTTASSLSLFSSPFYRVQ